MKLTLVAKLFAVGLLSIVCLSSSVIAVNFNTSSSEVPAAQANVIIDPTLGYYHGEYIVPHGWTISQALGMVIPSAQDRVDLIVPPNHFPGPSSSTGLIVPQMFSDSDPMVQNVSDKQFDL